MVDPQVLVELEALAVRSGAAASAGGPEREMLAVYEDLRARATTLARSQQWATPQEMADLFPSLEGLGEIEHLDAALAEQPPRSTAAGSPIAARVNQALIDLAAWARGIAIAYGALERQAPGDA